MFDVHDLAQLREVLAYQREVVPVVAVTDRSDPVDSGCVAQLAPRARQESVG